MTLLKLLWTIIYLIIFVLLTIISQIGGIVYFISLFVAKKVAVCKNSIANMLVLFLLIYVVATFLIVPFVAPIYGRERIKLKQNTKPASFITNILNRNYVIPEVNVLLNKTATKLNNTEIQLRYLDANFPFINGFPLLPHLSHNDGKKIDISYVYEDKIGTITSKNKTISGYGFFEEPINNEINQTKICKGKGHPFYDFTKHLTLGTKNKHLKFSVKGNRLLLDALLVQSKTSKIFIEPHLKHRLKLKHPKIRFQGCKAVRHDDHIHLQIY